MSHEWVTVYRFKNAGLDLHSYLTFSKIEKKKKKKDLHSYHLLCPVPGRADVLVGQLSGAVSLILLTPLMASIRGPRLPTESLPLLPCELQPWVSVSWCRLFLSSWTSFPKVQGEPLWHARWLQGSIRMNIFTAIYL